MIASTLIALALGFAAVGVWAAHNARLLADEALELGLDPVGLYQLERDTWYQVAMFFGIAAVMAVAKLLGIARL